MYYLQEKDNVFFFLTRLQLSSILNWKLCYALVGNINFPLAWRKKKKKSIYPGP